MSPARVMSSVVASIAMSAGCVVVPETVQVTGSGASFGLQSRTMHCGSGATLDRYFAGSGGMAITVRDGGHRTVYEDRGIVAGAVNDTQDVDGDSGTWSLSVDPSGFGGQFRITLACVVWLASPGTVADPAR